MYKKKYHIHFVGIGGIGMSGIAQLLINSGYTVSGSDIKSSDITRSLQKRGAVIFNEHAEKNIKGADVVVVSSAIRDDNPEIAAAKQASVSIIPRAEMLAEIMRIKYSIAVAGAHGKTSTTSLVAAVLDKGGLDPTVVIGGKLKGRDSNALSGKGDYIVAEADESDGSFLKFSPSIAVVTNIDKEHLDFYGDFDGIKTIFLDFLDRISFYGLAVLCLDNESVQELIPSVKKRYTTYGLSTQADIYAENVQLKGMKSSFTVFHNRKMIGDVELNLPGLHNIYNSLASIAVGLELDIPFETIKKALKNIQGVQRRLEIKGETNNVTVVDDYGHHPAEIKATLEAVKTIWKNKRKIVVFQPHRYSRTKDLFDEFSRAFYQTDILIVLPIYAASEKEIQGIDSHRLCNAIRDHGHKNVIHADNFESALSTLKTIIQPDDIVLTLGAGDVYKIGEKLL